MCMCLVASNRAYNILHIIYYVFRFFVVTAYYKAHCFAHILCRTVYVLGELIYVYMYVYINICTYVLYYIRIYVMLHYMILYYRILCYVILHWYLLLSIMFLCHVMSQIIVSV